MSCIPLNLTTGHMLILGVIVLLAVLKVVDFVAWLVAFMVIRFDLVYHLGDLAGTVWYSLPFNRHHIVAITGAGDGDAIAGTIRKVDRAYYGGAAVDSDR